MIMIMMAILVIARSYTLVDSLTDIYEIYDGICADTIMITHECPTNVDVMERVNAGTLTDTTGLTGSTFVQHCSLGGSTPKTELSYEYPIIYTELTDHIQTEGRSTWNDEPWSCPIKDVGYTKTAFCPCEGQRTNYIFMIVYKNDITDCIGRKKLKNKLKKYDSLLGITEIGDEIIITNMGSETAMEIGIMLIIFGIFLIMI